MRTRTRKPRGVSIIFRNSNDEVLLLLRDDKQEIPFPNCWDLPGGHVEDDETPQECIKREMLEEIEMEIENPRIFKVFDMADRIDYNFWQRADLDIATLPLHEGQRLQWFSESEIRRMRDAEIAFGFKSVLLEFYNERPWTAAP